MPDNVPIGFATYTVTRTVTSTVTFSQQGGASDTPTLDTATAYWRAIDYSGSGDWLDGSGNGFDAVVNGPTYVDNGDETDHWLFDGVNDDMQVTSAAAIQPGAADDFTLLMVIEPTAGFSNSQVILWQGSTARVTFAPAGVSPNLRFRARHRDAGSDETLVDTTNGTAEVGTIREFGSRLDRATNVMDNFIDGVADGQDPDTSAVGSMYDSGNMFFGSLNGGSGFLNARIYGISLWVGAGTAPSDTAIAAAAQELRGLG